MHKWFFVMFALLASVSLAQAGQTHHITRTVVCDERCQFQKHSPDTGIKPPIPREVCFVYSQRRVSDVTFTGYDVYEGPNSPNNHILRQLKHTVGNPAHKGKKFCLGVNKWVSKMVWVDICDDYNHSDRGLSYINEGLRTGIVRMCLDAELCAFFVR